MKDNLAAAEPAEVEELEPDAQGAAEPDGAGLSALPQRFVNR